MNRFRSIATLISAAFLLFSAQLTTADNANLIRMATTTSTDNSGLLNQLLPLFEAESGYRVHVIAVGTGKALRMGQDGDVDLVLVHAPDAEAAFVKAGYGEKRFSVMYNDFVIVGPKSDPATIRHAEKTTGALKRIAHSSARFISRGDDSGTHKKELSLWKQAALQARGENVIEAGQGMGKVLQMAGEMGAYTLTDRGTWLAYRDKSPLQIHFEGDPILYNPYGIIAVNPERHPHSNHNGAQALIRWITSATIQQQIGDFRIAGSRLFTPSADAREVATLSTTTE